MHDLKNDIHTDDQSDRQKGFIKELIQIAFTFGHDKDLFHKKVFEAFRVNSLREKEVILIEDSVLSEELRVAINDHKLSDREYVLCCLLAQGFSPDEIAVMLGLKNSHTVRVKQWRINRKLKASASPEVVWAMLCFSIIAYLLLSLFHFPGF